MSTNEDRNHEEDQKTLDSSKKKGHKKLVVIVALLIGLVLLACFVIYPYGKQYMQEKEDKKQAQKVIDLIDGIKEDEITVDSQKELDLINLQYDALSEEQKKLVSNYNKLENAYAIMTTKQDEVSAQSVIDKIESIDIAELTDSDVTVAEIRLEYTELTDKQKELVTNLKELEEAEQVINDKKAEKQEKEAEEKEKQEKEAQAEAEAEQKQNNVRSLVQDFDGYSGIWGDFGAHNNSNQGMIEKAIKSKISLSDYFGGDPNEVYIDVSNFQWDGTNINGAGCFITFEGPAPGAGQYRTLQGAVNVDSSGSLYFVEGEYY